MGHGLGFIYRLSFFSETHCFHEVVRILQNLKKEIKQNVLPDVREN